MSTASRHRLTKRRMSLAAQSGTKTRFKLPSGAQTLSVRSAGAQGSRRAPGNEETLVVSQAWMRPEVTRA